MEDFSATVQDLTRQIEERQRRLKERLQQERQCATALRQLLLRIQADAQSFDAEDARAIEREASAREEALQRLQRDADREEGVRREKEALFLQLHRTLQQRTVLLDAADAETGVLCQHEDLLRYFAEKQLSLTTLLKEKMRELAA